MKRKKLEKNQNSHSKYYCTGARMYAGVLNVKSSKTVPLKPEIIMKLDWQKNSRPCFLTCTVRNTEP